MKCSCGNPMREHIISLDDVWWICLICGRQRAADAAPFAMRPEPEAEIDDPEYTVKCLTCGLSESTSKRSRSGTIPRCGRCRHRIKNGRDPLTNEPVEKTCEVLKTSQVCIPIMDKSEEPMAKVGTCPTCKRPDQKINGTKCGRCYYRISKGQDPITGKPVAAQETTTPSDAATPPIKREKPVKAAKSRSANETQPSWGAAMFAGEQALLSQLLDAAKRNRRDLLGEILHRLDQSFVAA